MKAVIMSNTRRTQISLTTEATLVTLNTENLFVAVAGGLADAVKEVATGSVLKAIYVELWLTSDDTSGSSFAVSLEKLPGSSVAMGYAKSIALDTYQNRKNIFYLTQGLVGPNDEQPIPVMRGWFKIPKGKQRMGENDKWNLNISAISNGLTWCGFALAKVQE